MTVVVNFKIHAVSVCMWCCSFHTYT